MSERWVCLDVGETLVDETRVWNTWAELLDVPAFTLQAAIGAVIARDVYHQDAFLMVRRSDWRELLPRFAQIYGAFRPSNLYPEALPALGALAERGYRVAVIANQPAQRTAELRPLGATPDVMSM